MLLGALTPTNTSEHDYSVSRRGQLAWHYGDSLSLIKKTLFHPKADEALRGKFIETIAQHTQEERTIVYLDESGFACDMPRTHGYSTQGQRCFGEHDWHAKGRINVIGAIANNRFLSICLFETTVDSDVFFAWLTQDLIRKLPNNSIVVMDNATFHKRNDMREALETAGHTLLYLPPYSPDLNPIEHKWAQAKSIRRRLGCSTFKLFACPELC
jgi:transposase